MQAGCVSAYAPVIATFQAPAMCHRAIATAQALAMCHRACGLALGLQHGMLCSNLLRPNPTLA